ncbi:MAG: serine/threonine protein kinase [Pyrinomonadaceae bacterium]
MKPLAQNTLIQNRYLIVQLIGKGGMGEVYLAVDQRLGSAVALKRTYFAGDEMLANAFEREARTLARMRHPVLPKVSDHFGEGEEQYLVMEHISGDDLSKRLESARKPFPISWVLFWADQLLDALSYLHSHEPPIIHRDIKPQNLKLTDENNIILLDFGLSKTSTGQTNISQSGSTGSVVGYTPHYAPMEQIRGIGTSARSDLYSLSATLYQLLTNVVPADALSRADAMLNGSPDPVRPLTELNPEVSKAVSDVILKGMEVSQEKRFADAREMQKVLRKAFTEMQQAMSAQTLAFSGHETPIASTLGESLSPGTRPRSAASELETPRVGSDAKGPDMPAVSPSDNDFEATIAFDAADSLPTAPRQADIQTEVFLAGGNPLPLPDAYIADDQARKFATNDDWRNDIPHSEDDFDDRGSGETSDEQPLPDATMAVIDFDHPPSNVIAPQAAPAATPPSQKTAKKSSNKSAMVVGGLAALLVLAVLAAGGAWLAYSNLYEGSAAALATPSPEPSIASAPSPEPTFEAVTDIDSNSNSNSNANSFIAAGSSNSSNSSSTSAELTVAPTPAPMPEPDVSTKPAQQVAPVRTPLVRTPATSAARSTPKPKPKTPSDRTVILQ